MKKDLKVQCPNTNLFYRIEIGACESRIVRGVCNGCDNVLEMLGLIKPEPKKKKVKKKSKKRRVLFDKPVKKKGKGKKKRRLL